jgi:hypothetical protein
LYNAYWEIEMNAKRAAAKPAAKPAAKKAVVASKSAALSARRAKKASPASEKLDTLELFVQTYARF